MERRKGIPLPLHVAKKERFDVGIVQKTPEYWNSERYTVLISHQSGGLLAARRDQRGDGKERRERAMYSESWWLESLTTSDVTMF